MRSSACSSAIDQRKYQRTQRDDLLRLCDRVATSRWLPTTAAAIAHHGLEGRGLDWISSTRRFKLEIKHKPPHVGRKITCGSTLPCDGYRKVTVVSDRGLRGAGWAGDLRPRQRMAQIEASRSLRFQTDQRAAQLVRVKKVDPLSTPAWRRRQRQWVATMAASPCRGSSARRGKVRQFLS